MEDDGFGIVVFECDVVFGCFYCGVVLEGYDGSGLGLVIVCEIVCLYGGMVVLFEMFGGGLIVSVYLVLVLVEDMFV